MDRHDEDWARARDWRIKRVAGHLHYVMSPGGVPALTCWKIAQEVVDVIDTAPLPSLDETYPLVMYFRTMADRERFKAQVEIVDGTIVMRRLS